MKFSHLVHEKIDMTGVLYFDRKTGDIGTTWPYITTISEVLLNYAEALKKKQLLEDAIKSMETYLENVKQHTVSED